MADQLTTSRLANLGANAIYRAFDDYHRAFKAITTRVKQRFERRDWRGTQADTTERLELYTAVVNRLVAEVRAMLGARITDDFVWCSMKAVYSGLIATRDDWELAETFFNSATRRIFVTVGVNPELEFIDTDFATPLTSARAALYRTYHRGESTADLIAAILADYPFDAAFRDRARDTRLVAAAVDGRLRASTHSDSGGDGAWDGRIEMLIPVFYRNKAAYLIGRIIAAGRTVPFALALLNNEDGIAVDAVLMQAHELNILFSFTRSYFHVVVERPYDLVRFLATIMPDKRLAALYIAIGYHKHGKTELYRELLRHLATADDAFEIARGERGMVMIVFTLPSYNVVFKLIKDRFAPPKDTTRRQVMGKYHLVFQHDRAGRLVDAQEFEYLQFERRRFSPALLDELLRVAAETVAVEGDHVIIKHAYVERRVTPLDLYLRQADEAAARAATLDFGNAIKDLAASNIFPGDMLLKNFGVTRNGRVVFYDYDELALLTTCQFKSMPAPTSYDEEVAAEPWFAVGDNDVFPEEFGHFLGLRAGLREIFIQTHGDILTVPFWRGIQDRLRAGEIVDIFPYGQRQRLADPNPSSPR